MYTTFLPEGTALPTGAVTVIEAGRCIACVTTCCAAVMFAPFDFALELALALLELFDEPQPAATIATTRLLAATPAAPRIRLRAGVNRNMTVVSS
jgi:hypothetical protein